LGARARAEGSFPGGRPSRGAGSHPCPVLRPEHAPAARLFTPPLHPNTQKCTPGPRGMAFVFVWLRLSAAKLLSWARRSAYQSKDIAWVQKVAAERMADKASAGAGGRLCCAPPACRRGVRGAARAQPRARGGCARAPGFDPLPSGPQTVNGRIHSWTPPQHRSPPPRQQPTPRPPQARSSSDPWCRLYARLALAGLPRGGGNGDDIRMGILHIMRDHGIREGHRPVGAAFGRVCFVAPACEGARGRGRGTARWPLCALERSLALWHPSRAPPRAHPM
jgi:hypothetical protein